MVIHGNLLCLGQTLLAYISILHCLEFSVELGKDLFWIFQ